MGRSTWPSTWVIEKKLVLKVLAPELARREDLVARFLQEARSASRICHENVIDISDFGQSAEGYVYIAMEYLEGKDLGEVVRVEGALAWSRVRDIVMQICRALRAAHDKGIVHRDMKPRTSSSSSAKAARVRQDPRLRYRQDHGAGPEWPAPDPYRDDLWHPRVHGARNRPRARKPIIAWTSTLLAASPTTC